MTFNMDNYNDVPSRLVEFREKHPEGSLQQVSVDFREFAGASWVVYTAAAMRHPEDKAPGHGTAWEPVPGKTPYTKDSELQNAETSAWGRAIVAALAADTRKGIASAEDVRNRQDDLDRPQRADAPFVGKAVSRLAIVNSLEALENFENLAAGYLESGDWSETDYAAFAEAAETARTRLTPKVPA